MVEIERIVILLISPSVRMVEKIPGSGFRTFDCIIPHLHSPVQPVHNS